MSEISANTIQTHILEPDIQDGLEFVVRDPGAGRIGTHIMFHFPNGDTAALDIVSEEDAGKVWLTEWRGPLSSEHNGEIFRLILLEDRESEEGGYHRLRKFKVESVSDHGLMSSK
jgi:hypothetical protein